MRAVARAVLEGVGLESASVIGCVCIDCKEIAGALNGFLFVFCEPGERVSECIFEGLGVVAIGPWSTKPTENKVITVFGIGQFSQYIPLEGPADQITYDLLTAAASASLVEFGSK
jgi:hypothetical protein